jgi:YbbR domain-containing protein
MHLLTHNFGWKVLSLLAAYLIWLGIANDPDLATFFSAPVQFQNYPKDLEISSVIVDAVDVEAHGPAGQLRELRNARLSAIVDFSSVKEPGERTFTLTDKEIKLPHGVEMVRAVPAQLRFTFERRATRELKVDVQWTGNLPKGMVLSSVEVLPPTLAILGPESRVKAAKNAITDPIDLGTLSSDLEEVSAVYVAEPEVRFMEKPQVTVKIRVSPSH